MDPMNSPHRYVRLVAIGFLLAGVTAMSEAGTSRHATSPSSSVLHGCAPDTSGWSISMWDFFQVTATGQDVEMWDYYKASLHLSTPLDSAQIQRETTDSACAAAIAAFDGHFGTTGRDKAVVIEFDTLRSITIPPPARSAADSLAPIQVGHSVHLITNSDFSVVIDTLFY